MTHPSIDLGAVRTADRLWTPGFAVTWLATFVFWNAVFFQLLQRGGPTAYWVVAALLAGGLGLYLAAAGSRRAAARSNHAGYRRSSGTSL